MKNYLSTMIIASLLAATFPAAHGEPKQVSPARIVAPKDGLTTRQGANVDVMVRLNASRCRS